MDCKSLFFGIVQCTVIFQTNRKRLKVSLSMVILFFRFQLNPEMTVVKDDFKDKLILGFIKVSKMCMHV